MSPPKPKRSQNEKKLNIENMKLTRSPLYPDLSAEKENMKVYSSDDSPEKLQYTRSPRTARKSNSPSSTDSMQDIPGSPKLRNRRHLQNEINNCQDYENSDVDMETDDFVDQNHLQKQGQKMSEISPTIKSKEHLSPKSNRFENLKDTRKEKLNRPQIQSQRIQHSASTSSCFFLESNLYLILLFIILLICIFGIYMCWIKYSDTPSMSDHFNAFTLVNSLKSKFEDQPPLTFRIIHSALKNVLELQPKAPAIILLLATNGSEKVCSEFAQKLVDSLSVSERTIKIYGSDYKQANVNHAKMDIDKAISRALNNHNLGSVLINDLDQIPGKAAMILHTYCDHENAPYKKAVFVMTVNYNQTIGDYSDTKVWDKAANDHLLSIWTDIGVDQAIPLLARLTVSVAVVTARSS